MDCCSSWTSLASWMKRPPQYRNALPNMYEIQPMIPFSVASFQLSSLALQYMAASSSYHEPPCSFGQRVSIRLTLYPVWRIPMKTGFREPRG
ncbi:hypothetical protein WG66_013646 [Moniliophthora roreri]|nr:hypothetical protein WG66_013646 [Moniliophthora roreri]